AERNVIQANRDSETVTDNFCPTTYMRAVLQACGIPDDLIAQLTVEQIAAALAGAGPEHIAVAMDTAWRGTMKFLGGDSGIRGGLAVVDINDGTASQLVDAIDIPTTGVGAKERVDVLAIRAWIRLHQPQHAFIERAQAFPKQGSSSGFKYGRAVGAIE